jgi:hypothetical protein
MRNAVVVALVAIVALVGGYYLGLARSRVGPASDRATLTTQLPDGGMVIWQMKNGRPLVAHAYLLPNALDRAGQMTSIKLETYPASPNWSPPSN